MLKKLHPPSSRARRFAQIPRGFFLLPTNASGHLSLGSEKDNVSKNLPGRTRWICWRSFSKTMTMTRVTMLTMLIMLTMMTMAIKMTMTMMVRESTWTNLFNLLEEHLQGWLDDLKVPSELSHHILQGILKDHVLKVKVLSENTSYFLF